MCVCVCVSSGWKIYLFGSRLGLWEGLLKQDLAKLQQAEISQTVELMVIQNVVKVNKQKNIEEIFSVN